MEHDVAVDRNADSTKPVLWMAMELSLSKWKLGFSDGSARGDFSKSPCFLPFMGS
jgi:hypothetical protein